MNRGNTKQRYKTTILVDVVIEDGKVRHKLACGHDYCTEPLWSTVEEYANIVREHKGQRQRCDQCK